MSNQSNILNDYQTSIIKLIILCHLIQFSNKFYSPNYPIFILFIPFVCHLNPKLNIWKVSSREILQIFRFIFPNPILVHHFKTFFSHFETIVWFFCLSLFKNLVLVFSLFNSNFSCRLLLNLLLIYGIC